MPAAHAVIIGDTPPMRARARGARSIAAATGRRNARAAVDAVFEDPARPPRWYQKLTDWGAGVSLRSAARPARGPSGNPRSKPTADPRRSSNTAPRTELR